jgi:hypothetical protein
MKAIWWVVLMFACTISIAGTAISADGLSEVEQIHVVRSLRLSRAPATDYCAMERTAFENAKFEDQYDFRVVVTRPSDGAVADVSSTSIGSLHACFGPSTEPLVTNFFAEGSLGGVSFSGKGDCRLTKKDFPEPGLMVFRCYLDIEGLPADYVGGLLTTNTIVSRQTIGAVSDPPGYVQPSIATVRLWKARTAKRN